MQLEVAPVICCPYIVRGPLEVLAIIYQCHLQPSHTHTSYQSTSLICESKSNQIYSKGFGNIVHLMWTIWAIFPPHCKHTAALLSWQNVNVRMSEKREFLFFKAESLVVTVSLLTLYAVGSCHAKAATLLNSQWAVSTEPFSQRVLDDTPGVRRPPACSPMLMSSAETYSSSPN